MRQLLLLTVCFLSFYISSSAQISDTFDIATFQPPPKWKKQTKDGIVIFSTLNEQKGTYAMITLYGSGESSGDAKNDFNSDWQQFVVGQLGIKGSPQIEPVRNAEGWSIVTGGTTFQNEQGTSAIILSTYSGYGKTFSATAIFNSQDHLPDIEAFAASIKLRKPETRPQPAPANNDSACFNPWHLGKECRRAHELRRPGSSEHGGIQQRSIYVQRRWHLHLRFQNLQDVL